MPETDTKSVIDNLGGAAEMATMAIPEVGPAISAVISTGMAFFDIFYDDGSGTPLTHTATDVDLDNAVADIKKALGINEDQSTYDQIYHQTNTFSTTLAFGWDDLSQTKSDPDRAVAFFDLQNLDVPLSNSQKQSDTYAEAVILDENSDFYNNLQTLIDLRPFEGTQHQTLQLQALNLYLYAVNTFILYCKYCVILEYRDDLHSGEYPELIAVIKKDFVNTKDPALVKATRAWLKGGRKGPDPITARCKTLIKSKSEFVHKLHQRLEGVKTKDPSTGEEVTKVLGYIDYAQQFHDAVQARYAAYDARVSKAAGRVTISSSHDIYVDGKFKTKGFDAKTAKSIAQGYIGQFRQQAHQEEITDHYVDGFDEHYRNKLLKIIGHWSEAKVNALDFLSGYKSAEQESPTQGQV